MLDNTGLSLSDTTTLFYNTQGALIATGVLNNGIGLYDNSAFGTHGAPIFDPNGDSPAQILAWTGTHADSTTSFFAAGNSVVLAGDSSLASASWTASDAYDQFNTNSNKDNLFGIYAVSDILTVTSPEPSTTLTSGLAGAFLVMAFLRFGAVSEPRC